MPAKGDKKESKPKVTKTTKKVAKPKITDKMFEEWLYKQSTEYFLSLQKEWNEKKLKIRLKPQKNYDAWLNYFKALSPNTIRLLAKTGMDILPTEAYAALSRWHDIISNPHRIDRIHQSGLTEAKEKSKGHKTILELAQQNDRLGVLKATRDQIAEKLEKGAGARDTAALAREMTEIMTQIADMEKRLGPKKETRLGQLVADMPGNTGKRPARNGNGARHTSFRSRITIDDIEAAR